MATQKEQTLQIKQFRGVDRFTQGTAQEPDVFETIQNMSIENPGELKAINGVTDLGSISGITEILYVDKYETDQDNGIIVIGKTDPSTVLSAPTGWTVTGTSSPTGPFTYYNVFIEYVYPGGGKISTKFNNVKVRAAIAYDTLENFSIEKTSGSIPDEVISVNYYIGYTSDNPAAYDFSYIFIITPPATTVVSEAIYQDGGSNQYRVVANSYTYAKKLFCSGTTTPPASGTLTKVSGTGPATITYSAVKTQNKFTDPNYANTNNLTYLGSSYRVNGSFNLNILRFKAPRTTGPNGTEFTDYYTCPFPPGKSTFTTYYNANSNLEGGKTYYLGLSAWVNNGPRNTSVAYAASGTLQNTAVTTVMSVFIPEEHNAIQITFDFCPANGINDGQTGQIGELFPINWGTVFIGETPEDMVPAATLNDYDIWIGNNGVGFANAQNGESRTPFLTRSSSFSTEASADTLTSSTVNVPAGSILKMDSATAAGLTQNQFYYVKTSVPVGNGSTITLSLTPGGTVVNITAATNVTLSWSVIGPVKIVDCPHSVEYSCFTQTINSNNVVVPNAISGRGAGLFTPVWRSLFEPSYISYQPSYLHAVYFDNKNLTLSRRDLLWNLGQSAVNLNNYGWLDGSKSTSLGVYSINFEMLNTNTYSWQGRMYGNRLWMANGFCEPFYITRNMIKAGSQTSVGGSDTYQRWPITKYIEFFKNKMCLSSDSKNPSYDTNYVYFSKEAGDITYFHTNAGTPRAVPVNSGDQSVVSGLNIYSQDLSTVGSETFLVIGKEQSIFVWDGDPAKNPRQVSKNTGYAGPNCYTLTNFGPVFVGTDNVYLFRTSQDIIPIGYNFQDIIKNIPSNILKNVNTVFHNNQVKIGYTDELNLDREIWFKIVQVQGGLNNHWSGPHIMKSYSGQCVAQKWDSEDNVRVSFLNNKLYQRDDPGSFLNDGQDIVRRIKITNLGLGADQVLKVLTRLHLHLQTTEDEDFDMTLESEDGSQSIVVSFTDIYNPTRHMKQVLIPQRWLARVLTLSLENTNNSDLSIYDFSILFQPMRRRLLP